MNGDLLRIVDAIHRDRDIDKEVIFRGIEQALVSAARKRYGQEGELTIEIDRKSGQIRAHADGREVDPNELGRIAAQTAKQVIIQKIREAERDVIYTDFETRRRDVVHGTVVRVEGPNVIVNVGRTEGILPRKEQVPDEPYNVGDRQRFYVVDVKKLGQKVKIILSRSHPELIRRLFELEVPEIAEEVIEIRALVREAGYRTKIAVSSNDAKVDSVGACVGVRGSRIKSIIDEMGGEKIDIIRWSEAQDTLIANALKPAQVRQIELDEMNQRATVIVDEDQLSLAIGKRGQNVRLASRLTGWEIDIMTEEEATERRERVLEEFQLVPGIGPGDAALLYDTGYNSLAEMAERGIEMLAAVQGFGEERAMEVLEAINNLARESIRARLEAEKAGAEDAPSALSGEAAEPAAQTDDAPSAPSEDPAEPAAEAEEDPEPPADDGVPAAENHDPGPAIQETSPAPEQDETPSADGDPDGSQREEA